jgi:hypothetical protein
MKADRLSMQFTSFAPNTKVSACRMGVETVTSGNLRNMNLIVCPTRIFAIYLLAYISEFGNGQRYHIVILGDPTIPSEILNLASKMRVTFIKEVDARNEMYDELLIHSYALFEFQRSYIDGTNFKTLSFYSDGMRNGLYGLSKIDSRLGKLIYFGVELVETSFENSLPASMDTLKREVVSFSCLENIWNKLRHESKAAVPRLFTSKDLLLVMRYWDTPDMHYEFRSNLRLSQYLSDELSGLDDIERIIFRADPRYVNQVSIIELKELFGAGVEIVLWEDLFKQETELIELFEPESVIWSTSDGPGYFFGFDSSLNVLVANKWPQTKIIWPDSEIFSSYFSLPRSTHLVSEQISWMKLLDNQLVHIDPIKIKVDGFSIEQVITKIFISSKNIFPQERDALTQERDALVGSTIWRATRFIRALVSLARRTMGRFI